MMGGAGGKASQREGTASAKMLRPEKADHSLETVEAHGGESGPTMGLI